MKRWLGAGIGLAMLASSAIAHAEIKNPGTLVFLWTDDIRTLDPAYIVSTNSTYVSRNTYMRLLNYKGSEISEFVPALSTEVPSLENKLIQPADDGAISYTFPIREGVYTHQVGVKGADGAITWKHYDELSDADKAAMVPGYGELTAEDVKYSLMRAILQGDSWMANAVTEMITAGKYPDIEAWAIDLAGKEKFEEVDEAGLVAVHDALASKIRVEGDKVTLVLDAAFPATLGIMALPFATSIVDKEWASDIGDWDGQATTWINFHKPELGEDKLFEVENGSGPFMVEDWNRSEKKITLKRFDGYWEGPASLERVVIRSVPEWTTRLLQLEAGDADVVTTPVEFLEEVAAKPGIKVTEGLPKVFGRSLFYIWPVSDVDNPAIGSGKLDGKGIPPDFFGNIDVRKGFNYAQNYQLLLDEVHLGKTVQLRGPTVRGIMGYRPDSPVYSFDPEKAAEHFKKAYDGQLWENGFEMTGYITEGNSASHAAMSVLQQNLARINPKFKLKIQELQSATFADKIYGGADPSAPLAYMGWGPDYSDPGGPLGAATYYLSSTGLVAGMSGEGYRELMREKFDPLLAKAWTTVDPVEREKIYAKLQEMSYEYATTQFLWEDYGFIVTRDYVDGYVHNMIVYGAWDFYPITKKEK